MPSPGWIPRLIRIPSTVVTRPARPAPPFDCCELSKTGLLHQVAQLLRRDRRSQSSAQRCLAAAAAGPSFRAPRGGRSASRDDCACQRAARTDWANSAQRAPGLRDPVADCSALDRTSKIARSHRLMAWTFSSTVDDSGVSLHLSNFFSVLCCFVRYPWFPFSCSP